MLNWARLVLWPLGLLYGGVVALRHWAYNLKLFKSSSFDLPVISVGNLSVGGSGKTPHVEYLLNFLSPYLHVGVLSRGYKRKTTGYLVYQTGMDASQVGDEPLQYALKYPEVVVAVGERRAYAIPQLLKEFSDLQLIVLDDAFQHLAVKPGLQILLTELNRPFWSDFLMPAGRLREWHNGYKRADIIIITKCPPKLDEATRVQALSHLRPLPHQMVLFSGYRYHAPYRFMQKEQLRPLDKQTEVLLVCGIANENYLLDYLRPLVGKLDLLSFGDHHDYDSYDLGRIAGVFKEEGAAPNRIILTTEKDSTRLMAHANFIQEQQLPIYVLPIEVYFHFAGDLAFQQFIKHWLLDFKV